MKQIRVQDGNRADVTSDKKDVGAWFGTAAAYAIASLATIIVIGGLVWVAEMVWRAVL
jgi:hypothetical protein